GQAHPPPLLEGKAGQSQLIPAGRFQHQLDLRGRELALLLADQAGQLLKAGGGIGELPQEPALPRRPPGGGEVGLGDVNAETNRAHRAASSDPWACGRAALGPRSDRQRPGIRALWPQFLCVASRQPDLSTRRLRAWAERRLRSWHPARARLSLITPGRECPGGPIYATDLPDQADLR